MVCVPCVFVPLLLIIYRFIIHPILKRFYNFGKKDIDEKKEPSKPIKDCKDGVCTWKWKSLDEADSLVTEYTKKDN